MRLEGPPLEHAAKGYNIVSDGTAPGSIQVPGNGLPIVLLADRQTTGGYPKIATVISADMPALGRLAPGATDRVRGGGHRGRRGGAARAGSAAGGASRRPGTSRRAARASARWSRGMISLAMVSSCSSW